MSQPEDKPSVGEEGTGNIAISQEQGSLHSPGPRGYWPETQPRYPTQTPPFMLDGQQTSTYSPEYQRYPFQPDGLQPYFPPLNRPPPPPGPPPSPFPPGSRGRPQYHPRGLGPPLPPRGPRPPFPPEAFGSHFPHGNSRPMFPEEQRPPFGQHWQTSSQRHNHSISVPSFSNGNISGSSGSEVSDHVSGSSGFMTVQGLPASNTSNTASSSITGKCLNTDADTGYRGCESGSTDSVNQRQRDDEWVASFVASRRKNNGKPSSKPDKFSIREAQILLKEAFLLKRELQNCIQTLRWNPACVKDIKDKFGEIKKRLQIVEGTLKEPSNIRSLEVTLSRRKNKRARIRKRRDLLNQERQQAEVRRLEIGAKIDRLQQNASQKIQDAKKAEEVKKAADSILGEVRRKHLDAKRGQDLLKALAKLRQVRKEKAERKGVYTPEDADTIFTERLKELEALWERQLQTYSEEQRVLEVMMEVEHEETKAQEEKKGRQKEHRQLNIFRKNYMASLFGTEDCLDENNPLYPYRQYYEAAHHSIENLIAIRHEWDSHLIPEHAEGGSTVPAGWVLPHTPSSQVWQSALKQ